MSIKPTAEDISNNFGYWLKTARKDAGLTQEALAEKAEISTIALSKFERGVNSPHLENFISLVLALDSSPNKILGWETDIRSEGTNRKQIIQKFIFSLENQSDDFIESLISISKTSNT